jgi:hypothetical protein
LHLLEETVFTPERARALRALEVLERVGDVEAKNAMQKLAEGAGDAELTREAKAALERLAKRPRLKP